VTYRGIVRNGVIEILGSEILPEGAAVTVEVATAAAESPKKPTLLDDLGDLVGSIDDLPADFALNHEHYRYGTPKR